MTFRDLGTLFNVALCHRIARCIFILCTFSIFASASSWIKGPLHPLQLDSTYQDDYFDPQIFYQLGTSLENRNLRNSFRHIALAHRMDNDRLAYKVTYRRIRLKLDNPEHPLNSNTHNRKIFAISINDMDVQGVIQWQEGVHHPAVRNFMYRNGIEDSLELEAGLMQVVAEHEANNGGWPINANPPPLRPPAHLLSRFTLNNSIVYNIDYRDESLPSAYISYSRQSIDEFIVEASAIACKYYGWTDAYIHDALVFIGGLKGKRVAVVGSLVPWYESVALAAGAQSVTSIEYNVLDYDHPRISTVTNAEWYGKGGGHSRGEKFDVIFSISTFEHDGLGRYGDAINPDADIEACERMKQLAVSDGIMLLAVPTGLDQLHWNIHRVYGRKRLPLMLSSWKVEGIFGLDESTLDTNRGHGVQPVYVLRNVENPEPFHF